MSDIIRRKDAMEAMRILEEEDNEMYGCSIPECFDSKRAIEALEKLPSAEPEQKWIPVTERLPEDSETVLITHKGGVSFGWYNGTCWERGVSTKHRPLQTVIAWMPLPEPAKIGDGK